MILPQTCSSMGGGDRGTTRPACHLLSSCSRRLKFPSRQRSLSNVTLLLRERQLPIVSNASKVEFDQKGPEIYKPCVKIGVCCPSYASLLDCGRHIRIQRYVRQLHDSVVTLCFVLHSAGATPQHVLTAIINFDRSALILLTLLICMNDSTTSTSNSNACFGIVLSYLRARGNVPTMPRATYQLMVFLLGVTPLPRAGILRIGPEAI
jgi:hypothetical protein